MIVKEHKKQEYIHVFLLQKGNQKFAAKLEATTSDFYLTDEL